MNSRLHNFTLVIITIICVILIFSFKKWEKIERVIENDIHHYYGYLPALVIYNDIKLAKSEYRYGEDLYWFWAVKTEEGKKVFKMTMGLALLYAPFFFCAHIYAMLTEYSADGFSEPYKFFLLLSAIFYLLIGLDFVRKILHKLKFSEVQIALVLILTTLGTNLLAYSTVTAPMPHVYNFCLFAMFIYYSLQWLEVKSNKNAIAIGILFGLISLIRPSNAVIAIVPLMLGWKDLRNIKYLKQLIFYAIPAAGLIWLPQVAYWKYTAGHFFVYSYNEEGFNFLKPKILEGLFSFRKGWLIYTPLMLFALAGLFFMDINTKKFRLPIIVFLVVNIYIMFSWWCWWYGGSIGQRPMIESYALLAIPMAALVKRIMHSNGIIKTASIFLCVFMIALNVFQIFQFQNNALHWDSMSKKLYFAQFGKLDPVPDYNKLLDPAPYPVKMDAGTKNKGNINLVFIKASNGKYLSADMHKNDLIIADRDEPQGWETFKLTNIDGNIKALQSHKNLYLCAELDRNRELTATRPSIGDWERFRFEQVDENSFAIKAANDKYLSLDESTLEVRASKTTVGTNEIFIIYYK